MLQVVRSPKIYDVCIIGSGAAGGAAAKVLREGGVSVVMLEVGPSLDRRRTSRSILSTKSVGDRHACV
jgi:choline dehydrogenase-like flavoprotein